jgi:small subunit ribosomal protein S1
MVDSMEKLLAGGVVQPTEGSIVKGRVLEIRTNEVLVDIGYKSEGMIPAYEFQNLGELKVGDEVEVLLEKLEDDNGMVVLSKEKADQKKNWDYILKTCEEGGIIEGRVRDKVRGGLMVDVGVEAFLPASQIDTVPPRNLDEYVGNTYQFKIVKINHDRKNIVLSRRELVEQERSQRRQKLLADMKIGELRTGAVKNITDFGAFIDLNGIDGLLHVTDISWGRVSHPSEVLKVGSKIEVMVLDINREKERVSLGLKQKSRNPWDEIEKRYPVNTRVKGKVVNLMPYGAFVEIEEGIEGLIHVSEISWTKRVTRPNEVLAVGDVVEAVVLGINREEQKVSLGMRQLEPNPWLHVHEKFPVGSQIKGRVRNLTNFGAFVELAEGIDGMVHVSDMSWTRKINHPSEVLKKGDMVEAVVLEVEAANQRISLGMKQLADDPWKSITAKYKVGDTVTGKVSKIASFGAFIDLGEGIEGLVHISQISEERVEKIKNVLKVGDDVTARIVKIDSGERRIGLSIKALTYSAEKLEEEKKQFEEVLKPGEAMVDLEHAFDQAAEEKSKKSDEPPAPQL